MLFKDGEDITSILQNAIDSEGKVQLPKGMFYISRTIKLPSDCEIKGYGEGTKLVMASGVNDNMFTNSDKENGNSNISIQSLFLDGNWRNQFKPDHENRVSFCNLFYFAKCQNISLKNITGVNVLQTALHFNRCKGVRIDGLIAKHLGWSGISTSGTDDLVAVNVYVYDSGNDHRHSAIHLDGGVGSYVEADIDKCVGNGVMLDATFANFERSVVKANCRRCMRGVSCIGSPGKMPRHILIQGGIMGENEVGVMVSNSEYVFISSVHLKGNSQAGILFQGRVGGNNSIVSGCVFEENFENIKEIHASNNNKFFSNVECR